MLNFAPGKKTIATAAIGALTAWAAYWVGEPIMGVGPVNLEAALTTTWFALMAIFLRKGVDNATVVRTPPTP